LQVLKIATKKPQSAASGSFIENPGCVGVRCRKLAASRGFLATTRLSCYS